MTSWGEASARFAREPRWFVPAAFAWGLSEATLFFLVPDVIVGLVALHDWKNGVVAAFAAAAGAVVGGTLVFLAPDAFFPIFPLIPGISEGMVDDVGARVAKDGLWSLPAGPFSGLPYKLYAAHLGASGASWLAFAALTVPARLERILPIALALGLVGTAGKRLIARRPDLALGLYAAGWGLQYVIYYALIARKYGGL